MEIVNEGAVGVVNVLGQVILIVCSSLPEPLITSVTVATAVAIDDVSTSINEVSPRSGVNVTLQLYVNAGGCARGDTDTTEGNDGAVADKV